MNQNNAKFTKKKSYLTLPDNIAQSYSYLTMLTIWSRFGIIHIHLHLEDISYTLKDLVIFMSPAMIEFVSLPFSQRFYCYSSCPTSDDVFSVPQIVPSKKLGLRALHWHGPSHYQPVTIVVEPTT